MLFLEDWERKAINDAFDNNYDPPEDPIAADVYDRQFDQEHERQAAWSQLSAQGWGLAEMGIPCLMEA